MHLSVNSIDYSNQNVALILSEVKEYEVTAPSATWRDDIIPAAKPAATQGK